MKTINLIKGQVAVVDDEDFEWLNKWKWCMFSKYAGRKDKGKLVLMHRLIMNAPKGLEVDHINGNELDNRHENLRLATTSQNQANQSIHSDSWTGYKGVTRCNRKNRIKRYRANLVVNGKVYRKGYFATPEEAALAYNEMALKHFGEFAKLNEVKHL